MYACGAGQGRRSQYVGHAHDAGVSTSALLCSGLSLQRRGCLLPVDISFLCTASAWCAGAGGLGSAAGPPLLGGKYDPAKTRVWGVATLRRLQGGPAEAAANRFSAAALPWTIDLLTRTAEDSRGALLFRQQVLLAEQGEQCLVR